MEGFHYKGYPPRSGTSGKTCLYHTAQGSGKAPGAPDWDKKILPHPLPDRQKPPSCPGFSAVAAWPAGKKPAAPWRYCWVSPQQSCRDRRSSPLKLPPPVSAGKQGRSLPLSRQSKTASSFLPDIPCRWLPCCRNQLSGQTAPSRPLWGANRPYGQARHNTPWHPPAALHCADFLSDALLPSPSHRSAQKSHVVCGLIPAGCPPALPYIPGHTL